MHTETILKSLLHLSCWNKLPACTRACMDDLLLMKYQVWTANGWVEGEKKTDAHALNSTLWKCKDRFCNSAVLPWHVYQTRWYHFLSSWWHRYRTCRPTRVLWCCHASVGVWTSGRAPPVLVFWAVLESWTSQWIIQIGAAVVELRANQPQQQGLRWQLWDLSQWPVKAKILTTRSTSVRFPICTVIKSWRS